MSIPLHFAIIGLGSGGLIALLALGIVVIYRGSGVVNFAQGSFAMVGAYAFYDAHVTNGLPYAVGFAVGVAASSACSLATYYLVMYGLRNAPRLSRLIASLGVLAFLQVLMSQLVSPQALYVQSELPTSTWTLFGVTIGQDKVAILGIVLVIAFGIGAVYRYSQLGRMTTAALDNPRAFSGIGYSPSHTEAANWLVGGLLAGIAGVLLAPITALSVDNYTLLILPALAAAVVGSLTSMPLAVAGAVAIGIIQAEMAYYVSAEGWSDTAPFILILLIFVIRGVRRGARTSSAQRLPKVGTGQIRIGWLAAVLIGAILFTQIGLGSYWLSAVITTCAAGIILLSFVIVTGYSGQLSLAQFAFAGLGAWIAGKLVESAHMPLLLAVVLGIALVFPFGLLLGAICLRTSGINLTIATLGFAVAVEYLIFDSPSWTGVSGIAVGEPKVFGWSIYSVTHPSRYAAISVVAFVIAGLVCANVRRGTIGRRLLASRANERASASLGLEVTQARVYAFALGSMVAALGGIIMGFANSTLVLTDFSTLPSVNAVAQSVVGGVGWIGGAALGGLGQVGGLTSQALNRWIGPTASNYLPLAGAVLLILILIREPDGIARITADQINWVSAKLRSLLGKTPSGITEESTGAGDALASLSSEELEGTPPPPRAVVRRSGNDSLVVRELGVSFGGVHAVQDVSLRVQQGEIVGLIGANGAGKTTFIDAVSGFVGYRHGSVEFAGESLDGLKPSRRARRGVTRSFQSLELFDDLTVHDNLLTASDHHRFWPYVRDLVHPRKEALSDAAEAAIPDFGLTDLLDKVPPELSYGARRLVAIARAVATAPCVLLLDEPAAGLAERETRELAELLLRLARDWNMGILLVEHDVELVMRICDRVYVMETGRLIAEGPPGEVRRNEAVIASYLGRSEKYQQNLEPSQ